MDQPDLLDQPFDDPDLPHRYRGKRVIVTGAASGIGRATAIRLAAEGASVWCADINGEGAAATAARDHRQRRRRPGRARSTSPTPAACAGAGRRGGRRLRRPRRAVQHRRHRRHRPTSPTRRPSGSTRIFAVNAAGPFYLSQAALPHLLERKGNIVNLASTAGMIGQAYCAAYCASKHALVGLTKAMAVEYGRTGIRVNAVCPGGVNTDIIGGFMPPEGREHVARQPGRSSTATCRSPSRWPR